MDNARKAAILLSILPENVVAEIFKYLKEHEIEKLVKALITMEEPKKEEVLSILEDAHNELMQVAPLKLMPENLKAILQKALPPDKIEKLFEGLIAAEEGKAIFRELENMPPKTVANIIKNEHPQVIALILSQLKPQKAAEIIQYLPRRQGIANVQEEVIKRIASLEKVSNQMVKKVADTLEEEILGVGAGKEEVLSGVDIAAEIVNILPKDLATEILDTIRKENAFLADSIEEKMFKFEDIVKLDNKAIIEILKNVDKNDLLIALKGAPQEIIDKFLANMSKRAAQMFLEDMEVLGAVRKSDVENARKRIISVIKNLIQSGVIEYGGAEEMI
ncbi:flagellar motor switch protein FliG [Venenivibrio stagnispumantis]|uniref:Flagellar motor switch protein FliG n=1 Tax=Venenivibrio stagnispumantis TaxID=407998 RepID=A0AA45WPS7_9AQUI|nr:flagellar motor switch protein FliG [Venenivibrio stagnispumantis]MCW4572705.1 flagellar motor switch protein FliG [Venenivibrio stagnispumantis]SMP22788.1 flagellar motor switch protein FliG [Venenivibrio stagnispumantis]